MGGSLSRTKGHTWERNVATLLRESFPGATVRRSDQGFGAFEGDVVVEGNTPELIRRIWWECFCGRNPNPVAKLEQAERDTSQMLSRIPVVAWREHGAHTAYATLRLWRLIDIVGPEDGRAIWTDSVCTVPLSSFLMLLQHAARGLQEPRHATESPSVVPGDDKGHHGQENEP